MSSRPTPLPPRHRIAAPQTPAPLGYATPATEPPRPGALIALGIACLLVGALSLATNGMTAYFWFGAYRGSVPPAAPPQPGPLPSVTLPPYAGETPGSRGLP